MLGQRAAALHGSTGANVGDHGARDTAQVDAGMIVEAAIFDRQQAPDQVIRQIAALDQDTVFVVRRIDAADQRRFESHQVEIVAPLPAHPGDAGA